MTYYSNSKIRKYSILKKINAIFFFSILMMSVEACQFHVAQHESLVRDEIRLHHANELVQNEKVTEQFHEFDGDEHFYDYISTYIQKNSNSIDSEKLTNSLFGMSREHNYDPIFLLAVIKTESKFNENAIGSAGEIGLMQIKPLTAEWICNKNKIHWRGAEALKNPEYNILIGSYYFRYLKKTMKSKSFKYISAYNLGVGGFKRASKELLAERDYFNRVIENYLSIYSELKLLKHHYRV